MSNPFSRIKKGDYSGLQEALNDNFFDKMIPRELNRIVSYQSFLKYIESSGVRDIVVNRVLEHCIKARIYLNYGELLQAVLKKRLVGSLGLLCSYGITYIISHEVMLKVIGEKPDDRSIQMFRLYIDGALRNNVKYILFIYACMNLQIAWSESIDSLEVLNTAIRRNEYEIVRLLVLSHLYLDDENSINQIRSYAVGNKYKDLIYLLKEPDTSIVFGGDVVLSLADAKFFNDNTIQLVDEIRKLSNLSLSNAYIYAVGSDNYEELIEKARKLKIDPDIVDNDGKSALSYLMSAEKKKTPIISALIEAGANPFSAINRSFFLMPDKVISNESILKIIDDQNPTFFSLILANLPKERMNDVLSNNRTLLELVIETNNSLLVRLVLAAGVYVNTIEHPALNVAIMNGNEKIINMIMEKTEIFDQIDLLGNTSLHIAIQFGNLEIASRITMLDNDIGRKALRMQNNDGKFPLDLTDDEEFINEYVLLLDMKTLEVQNEYSPLHTLIRKDMFNLVKLVTERMLHVEGTDMNRELKDSIEKTLFQIFQEDGFLDYAIRGGRTRIVKYFRSLGLKTLNKEAEELEKELEKLDTGKEYNLKTALVTQRTIDKVKESKFSMKDAFVLAAKVINQNDKELLLYLFDELGVPINELDEKGHNLYDLATGKESIKKLLELYGFEEIAILPTKPSTKKDARKRYELKNSSDNIPQLSVNNRSETTSTRRHNDEDDETYIIVKDEDIRNQEMVKRDEEFARRLEQEEMSRITPGRAAPAYSGPTTTQRSTRTERREAEQTPSYSRPSIREVEQTPSYSRSSIREVEQTLPNNNAPGIRLTSKERTAKLLARKEALYGKKEY